MKELHLWVWIRLLWSSLRGEESSDEDSQEDASSDEETDEDEKKDEKKDELANFEDVIKDCERLEGLFSFYVNKDEGKVFIEILPEQLDNMYLCSLTREAGDGYYYDSGSMMQHFPFVFKRAGKMVQFIQKNVQFRAEELSPIHKAIQRGVSDSIIGSTKVESKPHPERQSILANTQGLFVQDIDLVAPRLNEWAKADYSFDADNSFISILKPFVENVEIEVTTHFKSSKPKSAYTMADPRSFLHRYHFSLSTIPETNYRPRLADDRIGHFLTLHQDYTNMFRETPYVRYVERWHLEKADPEADISPPRKPIVFWLENTIPVEYREAVKEGLLLWNRAFERIGFKDAIVVKQQPDDADWEAGDVRYNTIRWIVRPGAGYAVGPSRANPFTGELYHADIRISADFIRYTLGQLEEFVDPVSMIMDSSSSFVPTDPEAQKRLDDYQMGLAHHAAFGWHLLSVRGFISPDDPKIQKYLHDFIVHLTVHEAGHTLGLRHNFKASTVHPVDQLQDETLTTERGLTGSVMDYVPVNIAPEGVEQGQYWQTTLGPYDYWVIEYAYKPMDAGTPEDELEELGQIASRVAEPELTYGTDEDAFSGPYGIDPTCNRWDLGADPLEYHKKQIGLAKELWRKIEGHFGRSGTRYQKLRQAFQYGLAQYSIATMNVPKYIGGMYHRRDHVGDPGDRLPFTPVPAAKQREVLEFFATEFFAADAFQFSPQLLNKLAPERFWDFQGSVWSMQRIDYPLHEVILSIQKRPLDHFYDPILLSRLPDLELRYQEDEQPFTMAEMFATLRRVIWSELAASTNINSFRRELQRAHLGKLIHLVLQPDSKVPSDAISLARADLIHIRKEIHRVVEEGGLNAATQAHLDETAARIEAALKATVERKLL